MGSNRRRRAPRQSRRTILIATNGQRTEMAYLAEMKKLYRPHNTTVKIEFIDHAPLPLVHKLQRPRGNTTGFDEVWLVVDEDGADLAPFLTACRKASNKTQRWYAMVSRPCFEVWLIAHYGPIRRYIHQKEAGNHFRQLIPSTTPRKALPSDFPFESVEEAVQRCHLPGDDLCQVNDLPPLPGTAMPHLVTRLME